MHHQLFFLIINILLVAVNIVELANKKPIAEGNMGDEKSINGIIPNGGHLPIGPVVLVTGGAAGIGFNLIKELIHDPSVLVIIAADINETHVNF